MNITPASDEAPRAAGEHAPATLPSRGRLFRVWTLYWMVCLLAVGCTIFAFDQARGELAPGWPLALLSLCLIGGPLLGAVVGGLLRLHYSAHDHVVGFFGMVCLAAGSELGQVLGGVLVRLLCVGTAFLIGGLIGDQVGRLLFKRSRSAEGN